MSTRTLIRGGLVVTAAEGTGADGSPVSPRPGSASGSGSAAAPIGVAAPDQKESLKERALSDTGVQTMLDVFAAEIKDVEEM